MEKLIHIISAAVGGIIGFMFGEITGLFIALIVLMVIDYVTGIIKAYIRKELSSYLGFKGILKKICILLVVSVAHLIDMYILANDRAVVMNMALLFYCGNEGLSICENLHLIGVPIPSIISTSLKQAAEDKKSKDSEKKEGEDENGSSETNENEH